MFLKKFKFKYKLNRKALQIKHYVQKLLNKESLIMIIIQKIRTNFKIKVRIMDNLLIFQNINNYNNSMINWEVTISTSF